MRHFTAAAVALLTLSSALTGQAARPPAPDATTPIPRWHVGGALDLGQPAGDFEQQVNNAAGVQAHLLLRLDRRGHTALRFEASWLNYGHESQPVCLASTPGCRIEARVRTTNNILSLGIGPEWSVSRGPIRLYGHGLLGVSRFATLSSLDGGLVPDFVAADENFGDAGIFWSAGGGIRLPISRRTAVDLGLAFQGHGRREYLTEGGITDDPNGSLDFDVKRSTADLFAFRIGFNTKLAWGERRSTP